MIGGGTGGGAATIADGADVAEGATTDAAWVSGAGTVISLLKKIASAGGSAVSIADGSDVAEGTTTDVAVVTDASGTVIGFLRGLVKIFASVWDSVNGRLKVDGSAVTQPVTSTEPTLTVSGTLTNSGDTLELDLQGRRGVAVAVPAFSGLFTIEAAVVSGGTYITVGIRALGTVGWVTPSSIASAGRFELNLPAGVSVVRIRVTSTGTAAGFAIYATNSGGLHTFAEAVNGAVNFLSNSGAFLRIGGSTGAGTDTKMNMANGTAAAAMRTVIATDNTGPVKVWDGTNAAAVKAASTAAAATDPALVTRTIQLPAAVGQAAMAASLPVALASDQSAIPVTEANSAAILAALGSLPADVYPNDGPGPNYAASALAQHLTQTFDGRLRVVLETASQQNLAQLALLSEVLAVLRAMNLQLATMTGLSIDPGEFLNDTVN